MKETLLELKRQKQDLLMSVQDQNSQALDPACAPEASTCK